MGEIIVFTTNSVESPGYTVCIQKNFGLYLASYIETFKMDERSMSKS